MIHLKLAKIASSVLYQTLSNAINNNLPKGIFPDDARIALISLLEKGTSKENDISNFWPVSILTTSSKICGNVRKKLIDRYNCEQIFIPFTSTYR